VRPAYLPHDYYQRLAAEHANSPFLSPSQSAAYNRELAEFLVADASREIAEIGPGYGELLSCLGVLAAPDVCVWAIDSCPAFLERARQRWTGLATLRRMCVDIDSPTARSVAGLVCRLDRLVAINVLQDVDLIRALRLFRLWVKPGGSILVTVLAKETMDAVYRDNPLYDPVLGYFYKPATSSLTLGERAHGATSIPYERILRCYTLAQTRAAFGATGLVILRCRQIGFPLGTMVARWQASGTLSLLSDDVLAALRSSGVYVDAHEILARRLC
jgi:hypothetical protein